jgi:hypothetical protein
MSWVPEPTGSNPRFLKLSNETPDESFMKKIQICGTGYPKRKKLDNKYSDRIYKINRIKKTQLNIIL